MADECKNEYAAQLQNFNGEQWKHFNNAIPHIFKVDTHADLRNLLLVCEDHHKLTTNFCYSESAGHGSAPDGEARGDVSELRRGRATSHSHRVQVSGRDGFGCQSRRWTKGALGGKRKVAAETMQFLRVFLTSDLSRLPARTRPSSWSPSSPASSRRATSPSRTSARTWAGQVRTEPSATHPKESETETGARGPGPTPNTPWADPRTNCGSLAKNQR